MAKLANVRTVTGIDPIKDSDKIEQVWIDGWSLVCKKGEFKVGDLGLYMEVDTVLPLSNPLFDFLKERGTRTINNQLCHRLKSIKLRGTLSQGLLLPLSHFSEIDFDVEDRFEKDFGEELGLFRYDPDIHGPNARVLPAQAAGSFPSFIPKTDQERCLDGDTIILTPTGEFKLVDLVHQQYRGQVYCIDDTNNVCLDDVINTIEKHDDEWIEIEMENRTVIVVTKDHPIYLPNLGVYREAQYLVEGDELLTYVYKFRI